jgi:DNA-binding transcriptional ArsR family regulator
VLTPDISIGIDISVADGVADGDSLDLVAKLFRGLGDPSRLAILMALHGGPRNVSEVVGATGLSQSNASTHLHCLWCCGLVQKTRRGRFVYYRVQSREVRHLLRGGERLLAEVGSHVAACTRYEARSGARAPRRSGRSA